MASTIIGFRKQMSQVIPEQYASVLAKQKRLQEELAVCGDDMAYLRGLAHAANISLETVPVANEEEAPF